jgi:hypothetical protein
LVVPDIVEWKKPSRKTSPVYGNRAVEQYFISNFNGLFRAGFSVEYKKPSGAKIELSLREKDRDKELFREIIPLEKFYKNRMFRFSFPAQWDSAGKVYCLKVSAPEANPETDLRLLFDPGPFFHIKTQGKLYFDDKELPGELSMVSECRVRVNKNEFFSFWRNFLSDRGFAAFYTGIMIIAFAGAVVFFKREAFRQI